MELNITLDDLAILVTTKKVFTDRIAEEVKKHNNELENKYMALKEQIVALNEALTDQSAAITKEFNEVKAKLEAIKKELNDKIAALEAKVTELEGTDLSAEIQALKDSVAAIDAISESDVTTEE